MLAVGGEGERADRTTMAGEYDRVCGRFSRGEVPDLDCPIGASACELAAVAAEDEARDSARVSAQRDERCCSFVGGEVPQIHGSTGGSVGSARFGYVGRRLLGACGGDVSRGGCLVSACARARYPGGRVPYPHVHR